MENSEAPKDKCHTTYILFYALGILTLVPSHFFTTATDYWMYKFRNVESNQSYKSKDRTELQAQFTADYSIVSNVSTAVFIILAFVFIRKISTVNRSIFSLSATISMFVLTCIFVKVNTDSWQLGFMLLTLLTGSLLTGFCGIFLVTILELVPKFPPRYLVVIFAGQAICGILSALVQIVSLSVHGHPATIGLVYFSSGLVFVTLTLAGFVLCLKKSKFFKYHFMKEIAIEKLYLKKEVVVSITKKIKFYIAAMFIAAASSTIIHPGVTSLVLSVDHNNGNAWNDVYFGPVVTFLLYCSFDYFGRELAIILQKPSNDILLFTASCLRLTLVPMIMLCNAQPRYRLPVVFDKDYEYIIIIIIFAFSNGFLMNLSIIYAAITVTEDERPLAILFIMLLMIVSLAACSFASAGLVKAL